MKKSELMIGDWYSWYAEGKEYFYQVDDKVFSLDDDVVANFKPVKLTDSILMKNGFEYMESNINNQNIVELVLKLDDIGHIYYYSDGIYCLIEIDISVFGMRRYYAGKGYSVHELQQSIRICDMNVLADNFKVE